MPQGDLPPSKSADGNPLLTLVAWTVAVALLVGTAWLSALAMQSLIRVGHAVKMSAEAPATAPFAPPRWISRPRPIYPVEALETGAEGEVVVRCMARTDRSLNSCTVLEEDPPGLGFGQAALAAARGARMHPRRVEGVDTESSVVFTIQFRID